MTQVIGTPEQQAPKDLIGFLDFYLVKKAPFQIPDGGKEALVKYGPWIAVIFLILSLPVLLFALGLSAFVAPWLLGAGYAAGFGILTIGTFIYFGLLVAALPGLFARKMSGWTLAFYGELVIIVSQLLSLNIFSAIIGGLIGLYVLFQIRPLYRA